VIFTEKIIPLSECNDGSRVVIKHIGDDTKYNKDESKYSNLNFRFLSRLPVCEGLLPESILLKLGDFLAPVLLFLCRHL
jgi:hypothetical protein